MENLIISAVSPRSGILLTARPGKILKSAGLFAELQGMGQGALPAGPHEGCPESPGDPDLVERKGNQRVFFDFLLSAVHAGDHREQNDKTG